MDGHLDFSFSLGMKSSLFFPFVNVVLHFCVFQAYLKWSGSGWFGIGISSIDRRVYCIAWRFVARWNWRQADLVAVRYGHEGGEWNMSFLQGCACCFSHFMSGCMPPLSLVTPFAKIPWLCQAASQCFFSRLQSAPHLCFLMSTCYRTLKVLSDGRPLLGRRYSGRHHFSGHTNVPNHPQVLFRLQKLPRGYRQCAAPG